MPPFDCEGLVEGASLGEASTGCSGREGGPPREAVAGEDAVPHGEAAQTSAAAPTGPGFEGERHAMPDRRKRPRRPSLANGDPAGSFPEAAPEEAPMAVTISAGSPQGRRADATDASGAVSARFAGVRQRV